MKTNKLIAILLSTLPMLSVVGCTDPTPSTDEHGRSIINIFMNSGNTFEGVKKDSIVQKIEEEAMKNWFLDMIDSTVSYAEANNKSPSNVFEKTPPL